MAGEDPKHLEWIRSCPCCAPGCGRMPCEAHHHTGRRGVSQKTTDHDAMPLCERCHIPGFHKGGPPFHAWDFERRRAWQDRMVELYRPVVAYIDSPGHAWDGRRVVKAFENLPFRSANGIVFHMVEDNDRILVSPSAWESLGDCIRYDDPDDHLDVEEVHSSP